MTRRAGETDQVQHAASQLVVFHNALDISDVVRQLVAEGWQITADQLGQIAPYLRAHISRFGAYATLRGAQHRVLSSAEGISCIEEVA